MKQKKIRPEVEVYETYWKMTAGMTNIYTVEFSDCLNIIIKHIDEHKKEIIKWNDVHKKINSKQYFRGSTLYSELTNKIIEYMGYDSTSSDTSARKIINQYVKTGFIEPFMGDYSKYAVQFVAAYTEQEKKVLFSKIFYDGASFSSSMTVDNRSFGEVKFLLDTMQFNRYLTRENVMALMGTDVQTIKKGYMTRKELESRYIELKQSGFIGRKKIQFGHMTSMLNHFVDFKNNKKLKVFTFEDDDEIIKILEDETIPENYKRDTVKHRIYKEELKLESIHMYGKAICYFEKLPYQVLIASHIKECAKCLRENHPIQAYDVNNGLLLSPNVDSYFDKHDISFDDDGTILFGARVDDEVRDKYKNLHIDENVLNSKRLKYLKIHRELFYKKEKMINKIC